MQDDHGTLSSNRVDFIVAVALPDEYKEFVANLPTYRVDGVDTIASIPRINSTDSYRIAVIVTGQTTAVAQAAVSEAITRCKPGAVLLVGIAAGFPENGVDLGDILVPFFIAPYEYVKISEQPARADPLPSDSTPMPSRLRYDHRNLPLDVSHPLWNQAAALSRDPLRPWLNRISVSRPASSKSEPAVHADSSRSVLGSGDKLVASQFAEARRWLIEEFGANAMGLEMEGYGALMACRSRGVPFLLVKAVQDPATGAKDDAANKDEWRGYSAAAAAAFALTFIERCRLPTEFGLVQERRSAIPSCFVDASDEFSAAISRNFLFEFEGRDSDYMQLLSRDLRHVFFHEFNKKLRSAATNRMVFSGREGSGKTFNVLLLSLQLSREGYTVYYCADIRVGSLIPEDVRAIAKTHKPRTLLIIDNVQHDVLKAADLITAISHTGSYTNQPLFLFLSRPLDKETFRDTFSVNTPVLGMVDKFVDFERLVTMFFKARGRPEAAINFLKNIDTVSLSGVARTYRNMAFWNEVLRSLLEDDSPSLTEERILARAHSFFRRKEPELLSSRDGLSRLLPLFSQGIPIHIDYARELLGHSADSLLAQLEQQSIVRIVEQDWSLQPDQYGHTSVLVVASRLHVTKAKLLAHILGKYYGYAVDPVEATARYAERFSTNLHYTLAAYYNPEDFQLAFTSPRIRSVTRQYLLDRHVGRQLDFLIRRIGALDEATCNALLDEEVLAAFAEKVNDRRPYLVSKVCLLRAVYRQEPKKAFLVFKNIRPDAVTYSFINDPTQRSITSLAKVMEILKNIYLTAPEDAKESVQAFVRQIIDECRSEFVERIVKYDPFISQLHWMLKRLRGLGLNCYFMEGIAPDTLIKLIRTKDTNILELSKYILGTARSSSWVARDGSRRSYYEILRENLAYGDLKRVFDNKRSDLFDLTTNATHDFVAKALVEYSDDPNFKRKVIAEKPYLYPRSLALIRSNQYVTETEKHHILSAMVRS